MVDDMPAFQKSRYFLSWLPSLLPPLGNVLGGSWTMLYFGFAVAACALDWFVPKNRSKPAASAAGRVATTLVLLGHVALHTAGVVSLLAGVATGRIAGGWMIAAAVSTGLSAGLSGINVAHELIHRSARSLRMLGLWNLLTCGYGHWMIEHVYGHHRHVGTELDPATARRGETVYWFFARNVVGQFIDALRIEAERLRRRRRAPYGLGNFVVRITLLESVLLIAVAAGIGPPAAAAWCLQALVAVFLLESTNYMEHYGLTRTPGEPVRHAHAWQTDVVLDRILWLELVRHADHHVHASRPYPELESHAESPELPTGYYGMFPVALVPSLWFRTVHPILDEHLARHRPAAGPILFSAAPRFVGGLR